MSERTVLASFYSRPEAQKAADQVKSLGIDTAEVAELHGYSDDAPPQNAYLISGKISSLSSVTLGANPSSRDVGILLSADPAAYSMAGNPDRALSRNYLLTVVCPDEQVDTVVNIIKDCNGFT
ncbi:hypothetical protein JI721_06140 [Alicyclobacillus cycloheptanicus]|uniref:Heat induced stress protein YflT n=1 Tax=Alicyclobacillus cycloheptanicus TaxID=1457 RepID=A0ABT9XKU8_9BACL|nr:hypothetical protein [Alicyclobacillus cycloheptanicus]MDQ0190926.1 hypothetical protein [Alicyclobacillus cycloheptanicus]WDM02376.1 hypothetical protein JI721_06140 [Alicyclobacillus cycloheptanicus]